MIRNLWVHTFFIGLLIGQIVLFSGCPTAMDSADGKLVGVNNSDRRMAAGVKDAKGGFLTFAVIPSGKVYSFDLLYLKWDQVLPGRTDSLNVIWLDFQIYSEKKGSEQFNDETCSKHIVCTRAQLDSTEWKVYYP
jgi:hypothetical protein